MHIPVLLHEAIDGLAITPGDVVIDGTFGGGGHTNELIKQYGDAIKIIAVDLDEKAEARFQAVQKPKNVSFVAANFKDAPLILNEAGFDHADKVLLDLGTSTFQLLNDDRGFSFNSDAPLLMTFAERGSHTGVSAYDVVNSWAEETLETIFRGFGEEKRAKRIARVIAEAREAAPIKTSRQLAELIERLVPRQGKIHPATRVFQAIRIAVNDELTVIAAAIDAWWNVLPERGRIAIITFHSLEDRVVKRAFASYKETGQGALVHKKPIVPGKEEIKHNRRSRSAKLRVIEKLA